MGYLFWETFIDMQTLWDFHREKNVKYFERLQLNSKIV